jgi:hypothetical protein
VRLRTTAPDRAVVHVANPYDDDRPAVFSCKPRLSIAGNPTFAIDLSQLPNP